MSEPAPGREAGITVRQAASSRLFFFGLWRRSRHNAGGSEGSDVRLTGQRAIDKFEELLLVEIELPRHGAEQVVRYFLLAVTDLGIDPGFLVVDPEVEERVIVLFLGE